jgi:hypothetical protein
MPTGQQEAPVSFDLSMGKFAKVTFGYVLMRHPERSTQPTPSSGPSVPWQLSLPGRLKDSLRESLFAAFFLWEDCLAKVTASNANGSANSPSR